MIALIDCNNFYASCERLFNPQLRDKPIAVLSSNDGCIIARSNEVKKIGIPMGAPVYKWRDKLELYNVQLFSANFTLYGDISRRVMDVAHQFSPRVEIYSIDEAFLFLDDVHVDNFLEYGLTIKNTTQQWTGAPISVGIAPTKTLAKLANKIAKKFTLNHGSFVIDDLDSPAFHGYLDALELGDVWGLGWRYSERLNKHGIYSIRQFMNADPQFVRKMMGVTGLRTHSELNGTRCITPNINPEPKKSIVSSRTFSKSVDTFDALRESVATFTARAAQKLRKDNSAAGMIHVWIKTNKHRTDAPQYRGYDCTTLPLATCYTPNLIHAATNVLHRIYRDGYLYKKSMIMLTGIIPQSQVQANLFHQHYPTHKYEKVMSAVDSINHNLGSRTISFGSTGTFQPWKPKQELRSPRYTTSWEELFTVKL